MGFRLFSLTSSALDPLSLNFNFRLMLHRQNVRPYLLQSSLPVFRHPLAQLVAGPHRAARLALVLHSELGASVLVGVRRLSDAILALVQPRRLWRHSATLGLVVQGDGQHQQHALSILSITSQPKEKDAM